MSQEGFGARHRAAAKCRQCRQGMGVAREETQALGKEIPKHIAGARGSARMVVRVRTFPSKLSAEGRKEGRKEREGSSAVFGSPPRMNSDLFV